MISIENAVRLMQNWLITISQLCSHQDRPVTKLWLLILLRRIKKVDLQRKNKQPVRLTVLQMTFFLTLTLSLGKIRKNEEKELGRNEREMAFYFSSGSTIKKTYKTSALSEVESLLNCTTEIVLNCFNGVFRLIKKKEFQRIIITKSSGVNANVNFLSNLWSI